MTATIAPFPAKNWAGRIRRVTETIAKRSERAAESYWQRTIDTYARQMVRANIDDEVITRELSAFAEAVQIELQRTVRRYGGDDAA